MSNLQLSIGSQARLADISDMLVSGYSDAEIKEYIQNEYAVKLSSADLEADKQLISQQLIAAAHEDFEAFRARELARIAAVERQIYRQIRAQSGEIPTKRSVRTIRNADGEIKEEITDETYETIVSPVLYKQLLDQQRERRKIMGAYAPKQVETNATINVKGYHIVSPDDWDDDNLIEGEISE